MATKQAKAASQAQAQQQAQTPAQASPNPAQAAASAASAAPMGIQFAKPKAEKAKSDRAFCDHVTGQGEKARRCQLRVLDGRTKCVNHVPAEERLTEDEAKALLTLVGGLDEAQQVRLLTRAIGWWKVKKLVAGEAEGDVVLNELVG